MQQTNTLLYLILPVTAADYEEFGYPWDNNTFHGKREYSPYDNIQKDVPYPALLISSSFTTRYEVWEAAKWVDPKRSVLLNLTTDIVEENGYLRFVSYKDDGILRCHCTTQFVSVPIDLTKSEKLAIGREVYH